MKRIVIIVGLGLIIILMCGCKTTEDAKFELMNKGLIQASPLRKLEGIWGIVGDINGSFFLGSGSISGYISNQGYLLYAFSPIPDRLAIIRMPMNKIDIHLSNVEVPQVQHIFNLWTFAPGFSYGYKPSGIFEKTYGEIITVYRVKKVILTISEEQLKNRQYLWFSE